MPNDKIGADDFLANGGTLAELIAAARPLRDRESSVEEPEDADDSGDVYRRTHRGSALRLVSHWGRNRFLWCPITGWYAYDESRGIWLEDSHWRVHGAIAAELPALVGAEIAALEGQVSNEEVGKHRKYQHEVEFNGHIEGTMKLLQAPLATHWSEFDVDSYVLGVGNGALHFSASGVSLEPHSPTNMITKATPVNYRPDARSTFWKETLTRFLPNEEQREYAQRLAGAILVRGGLKEQILPILSGTGANGKSTFAHGIRTALGEDLAIEVDPSTLRPDKRGGAAPSPDKVRLRGARYVVAAEAAGQLDAEFLKRITGGESIVARQLHGKTFAFKPGFTLMLLVNEPPEFQDTTEGLWRRVQVIPFSVRIPDSERIDALTVNQLIDDQAEGVLTWMVEGCVEYLRNGLNPPESVKLATGAMRGKQDPVGQFLAEYVIDAEGEVLQPKELYAEWVAYTEDDADIRNAVGGKTKFTTAVDRVYGDRGQARVNGTPTRGWVGKTLRSKVTEITSNSPINSPMVVVPQKGSLSEEPVISAKPLHTEFPDSTWFDLFSFPHPGKEDNGESQ